MIIKLILCCLLSCQTLNYKVNNAGNPNHAMKISHCKIIYDENSYILNINFTIFRDDLEAGLSQEGLSSISKSSVCAYIRSHFSLTLDGSQRELTDGKIEQTTETIVTTFVMTGIDLRNYKELAIENTLLLKQFRKQRNLIHLQLAAKEKYTWVLKAGYTRESVKL